MDDQTITGIGIKPGAVGPDLAEAVRYFTYHLAYLISLRLHDCCNENDDAQALLTDALSVPIDSVELQSRDRQGLRSSDFESLFGCLNNNSAPKNLDVGVSDEDDGRDSEGGNDWVDQLAGVVWKFNTNLQNNGIGIEGEATSYLDISMRYDRAVRRLSKEKEDLPQALWAVALGHLGTIELSFDDDRLASGSPTVSTMHPRRPRSFSRFSANLSRQRPIEPNARKSRWPFSLRLPSLDSSTTTSFRTY